MAQSKCQTVATAYSMQNDRLGVYFSIFYFFFGIDFILSKISIDPVSVTIYIAIELLPGSKG